MPCEENSFRSLAGHSSTFATERVTPSIAHATSGYLGDSEQHVYDVTALEAQFRNLTTDGKFS
jgi:hypothetical protein